jgi:hypothetical protein
MAMLVAEAGIGAVQEEQVFPLDIENDSAGILHTLGLGGVRMVEEAIKQKHSVRGLGSHPRDPSDVDVGALGAVQIIQIGPQGLAVAGETDGETAGHGIEEKGPITLLP